MLLKFKFGAHSWSFKIQGFVFRTALRLLIVIEYRFRLDFKVAHTEGAIYVEERLNTSRV